VSDRYGRKAVVYVAGTMMAVIPLILIVTTNFTVMILSGLIFGLAYGSYITYQPSSPPVLNVSSFVAYPLL
jgi:MFS family permease